MKTEETGVLQGWDCYRVLGLLKLDLIHFCIMVLLQAYGGQGVKCGLKENGSHRLREQCYYMVWLCWCRCDFVGEVHH